MPISQRVWRRRSICEPMLLLLLVACGDDGEAAVAPAAESPQARPATEAETPEPAEPTESDPEPMEAVQAEAPEPLATPPAPSEGAYDGTLAGLPPVAPGRPVRLDVVDRSTERVDGRRMPRAAITDPEAKASLDALLDDFVRNNRCQLKLATETFVSVECTYEDEMEMSMGLRSTLVRHFQVGEDGRFVPVPVAGLLHPQPGVDEPRGGETELLELLERANDPADADLVFIRTGLQIVPRSEDSDRKNIGWRVIAPYLRADSALGRQLADKGVELAPVGTPMPELPPETWILPLMDRQDAAHGWMALPPELQADVRLIDPPALILAPGHARSELPDLDVGEWVRGRWIGPLATFGMRQVDEDDRLRSAPGAADDELDVEINAGDRLTTVEGVLGDRRSSASRGWCYAFSCETQNGRMVCVGGWLRARNLSAIAEDSEPGPEVAAGSAPPTTGD